MHTTSKRQTARRTLCAAVALAAAGALTTGCSGNSSDAAKRPDPAKTSPAPEGKTQSPEGKRLPLPDEAKVLLPQQTGSGPQDLPDFKPAKGTYTLYARCEGKGDVSVVDTRDKQAKPIPIKCDGAPTAGQIHDDIKTQHLRVEVTGGTPQWRIAAVEDAQQL